MGGRFDGRKVVVIDPAFLGDTVFNGPLVRRLQEQGAAEVAMVVRPVGLHVAQRMRGVDRVFVYDKYGKERGVFGFRRCAQELRAGVYDVALLPHPSLRSALLAWRAGVAMRVGFARHWVQRPLLTDVVHAPRNHSFVAQRLAFSGGGPEELAGVLGRAERPPGGKLRVGLVVGANFATKVWPKANQQAFVEQLDPDHTELVLLGDTRDLERAPVPPAALSTRRALGGSVEDLLAAVAGCDVVVGADTGPVHAARGMGLPAVVLFGPTSGERHVASAKDAFLSIGLDCQPCSSHGGPKCPKEHHRCLQDLPSGQVLDALKKKSPAI